MAGFNDRRCHIAYFDSRGEGLQTCIDSINTQEYISIRVNHGATLQRLSRMASTHLDRYPFDVVYIAGGACDITRKNKATKEITFSWDPLEDLEAHLLHTLKSEAQLIYNRHPASKAVFCPLVGSDLVRVLTCPNHLLLSQQQQATDDAVFAYNMEIFDLNKKRNLFSPSLHRTVHRSKGANRKSHYHHLEDGLHLTEDLRSKWATELVKASSNN